MNNDKKTLLAMIAVGITAPGFSVFAQPPAAMPRPPQVGPRAQPYLRLFDTRTVQTVEGELKSIDREHHRHMEMSGVHVTVKTKDGDLVVHLGPSWFIDNQEPKLQVGDKVTITGSRVTLEGAPVIIATEVKRGADTLKLREADGTPLWVAWRRAS